MKETTKPIEASNSGILSVGYGSLALAYMNQVRMTTYNSVGTKLLSTIGGPVMAAALCFILMLGRVVNADTKSDCSSKLMNGTLIIYSFLCLVSVGLAPQLDTQFGNLYFISALLTFAINAKGYSRDLSISGITLETKKLLPRIHDANLYAYTKLKAIPNLFYMIGMLAVILMKVEVFLPILLDPFSCTKRALASKVSILARLSVIGGSLVTLRDSTNVKILKQGRFRVLNVSMAFVFGSLAATALNHGTSFYQLLKGSLLVISAIACFTNSII